MLGRALILCAVVASAAASPDGPAFALPPASLGRRTHTIASPSGRDALRAGGLRMSTVDQNQKEQPAAGAIAPKWHLDAPPKSRPNIPVSFEDICMASHRIRGAIVHTACTYNPELSEITGVELYFKHEYKQFTGSFKERGARNALMVLPEKQKEKGVIAASAGNHALGLAYHAKLLGMPVTVVMPETAPLTKVFKCRKLGANVVLFGQHIGEAKDHALSDPKFNGLQYINGYDDPAIVAGAGSIGLEILEQVPDVDAVVIPVGGAGLIAGISLAIKSVRPDVEIIGVEPERCASYTEALKKGYPSPVAVAPTLADGLAVPTVGPHAFEVAKHFVDRVVLTNEMMVALSVLRLVEHEKAVVEGGGATGLAALLPGGALYGDPRLKGKKVVVPLCGGNIDTSVLGRVIERGLAADRRLVKLFITVSDRPGGLAKLTRIISEQGASIWDISHERAWLHSSVDQVRNGVVVELTGAEHEQRLIHALRAVGYPVEIATGGDEQHIPPGFAGYRETVVLDSDDDDDHM